MSEHVSRRRVIAGGLAAGAAGLGVVEAGRTAWAGGSAERGDLVLGGATVIDPAGGRPRRMNVRIRGGRIAAVTRHDEGVPAHGGRVVDLTGKYLIPGLWDMHAHSIGSEQISPPLYALNGVTGVREMAGSPVVTGWRDAIEAGRLLGPRWVIASAIVDGYPSLLAGEGEESPGIITVADAAQARQAVRRVKAEGADFVKLYSRVSRDAYLAIVAESRRQRIPFAGHCPDLVPVELAVTSGHRSIEHLHALPLSTSRRESEVRRLLAGMRIEPGDYHSWFRQIHPIEWLAATHPSAARRDEILELLVRHHTAVTPTVIMHQLLDMPEDAVLDDPRLQYVPAGTREFWNFILEKYYKEGRTPAEMAQQRELYEHRLEFVRAMQRAGVRLMAGSEAGLVYAYPGFSLHDELAELVRAGLTPLQALRTATTEPARFLGLQHTVGSIRHGMAADLVVLDANPLADIRNTARINSVVVRGRLIESAERNRLLSAVADAAEQPASALPAAAPGCICHMPAMPPGFSVSR